MGMTEHRHNGLVYQTADSFTAAGGVVHAFSTRLGGVSEGPFASLNLGVHRGDDPERVRENYRRFCSCVGAAPDRLVFSNQVHRDQVRVVTRGDEGKGLSIPVDYEADALVTNEPGLTLAVFTADCIPVLLYDPAGRSVGAVHAGWRGAALGIAARAVETMGSAFGARPGDILAAVGPGLSQCCFETDGDVPDAMMKAFGEGAAGYLQRRGQKWHVDLKGINALCLRMAGVLPEHIAVAEDCTRCRTDKYWSHRAVGKLRGSQAAVISLAERE